MAQEEGNTKPWTVVRDDVGGDGRRSDESLLPPPEQLDVALDEDKMPPNAKKLLRIAEENDWQIGPVTLVVRLQREGAKPLFARWDLKESRWSFAMCRVPRPVAGGLMPLKISDAFIYLQDTSVIYPEDPEKEEKDGDCQD